MPVDCDDIMLVDDERTYELIDHMFATLSECFSSKKIHIGMDEAHMLGRGKHLDIHGYESVDVIIKRHLERVCQIAEKYGYLFDTLAKLCDVLSIKYDLGVKTRKTYHEADKDELCRLANEDYTKTIKYVDAFGKALEKQWFCENKTSGFDVQDLRIGGLIRRLQACKRRLLDYADGKIECIEELEGDLLPFGTKEESIIFNNYANNATINVF